MMSALPPAFHSGTRFMLLSAAACRTECPTAVLPVKPQKVPPIHRDARPVVLPPRIRDRAPRSRRHRECRLS